MKKILSFILLLSLIVSLSACGGESITIQEVYDASQLDTILKNHKSVTIQHMIRGVAVAENYLCREYVYDGASDWAIFMTDHAYYQYDSGNYQRVLLLSPDGLTNIADFRHKNYAAPILGPDTLMETIQSVTNEDNRITVASSIKPEDIPAMETKLEGMSSYNSEYVLDAKNHDLLSVRTVVGFEDGTTAEVSGTCSYDVEMPERIPAFLEYDGQTEDLRTITVVSQPGTENEKSESVQIPNGLAVRLGSASDTGETFVLYADAACTEPYVPTGDYHSDTTIYVKWGE